MEQSIMIYSAGCKSKDFWWGVLFFEGVRRIKRSFVIDKWFKVLAVKNVYSHNFPLWRLTHEDVYTESPFNFLFLPNPNRFVGFWTDDFLVDS